MSAHVETARSIYAAFGRGDVPFILSRLAEDVHWEHDWGAAPLPLYAERRGRDAVPGFFAALAALDFLHFEPLDFLASATRVAVPVRIELRVRANGRIIRDLESHWWTFDDAGAVVAFRHMADTRQFAAAMAA